MTTILLIGVGADVNKALLNGTTPLHFAAQSGNKFIGWALLEAQAGINVRTIFSIQRSITQARASIVRLWRYSWWRERKDSSLRSVFFLSVLVLMHC